MHFITSQPFILVVLLVTQVTCLNTKTCKERLQERKDKTACCRPPWLGYGKHCYLFVNQSLKFDDAELYCRQQSLPGRPSHLVSIASDAENSFTIAYATSIVRDDFWIGLTDRAIEAVFVWEDGSLYVYHHLVALYGYFYMDCLCVNTLNNEFGYWKEAHCENDVKRFVCKM